MIRDPDPLPAVVIGGGVAGLAAANALTRAGLPAVVLEASDRFGGVVRTIDEAGFRFEAGPDAMLSTKADGVRLCRDLGLDSHLIPTNPDQRAVYVVWKGALHRMPEGMVLGVPTRWGPVWRSALFSISGTARMACEPFVRRRQGGADESVASFLRRRLGREAWQRLGDPLLGGIHAGDTERLSVRATFPRLVEMEARSGSLVRAFRANAAAASVQTPDAPSAFVSLAGGLGEMVDALAARLSAALRPSSPVRAIERLESAWRVLLEGGEALHARSVVVALPAPRASSVLRAAAPGVSGELAAIPFVSTAIVLLGFRRDAVAHPLDGYGLLVPRTEGLRLTAAGFFSTKFPGRAPAGCVSLRAFLGSRHDPHVLDQDDDTLVADVLRELTPLLGLRGAPLYRRVCRWPASTPQMELGHLERVARIDEQLRRLPGLFVTGAGLRVTGLPDTIADANAAAAAAAAYLGAGSGSH